MQKLLFILLSFTFPYLVKAQRNQLIVQGTGNHAYLLHTVKAGENFFSVSRMYNTPPRELASYNQLSMDNGLKTGQSLKIPLSSSNFTQSLSRNATEALAPVVHVVAQGETLFRIGANFGNVPLSDLKDWNNLSGDNVNSGAQFIIGFLRVNKSESALAGMDFRPSRETSTPYVARANRSTDANTNTNATPPAREATAAVNDTETSVPDKPIPVVQNNGVTGERAGFFAPEFEEQSSSSRLASQNGTAAVFKSTSGWQDAKYYCFNNNAAPGSIVKIYNGDNSKFIFAKVLDAIPDIKQNEGLSLVLSNAAADALGISGEQFNTTIQYYR